MHNHDLDLVMAIAAGESVDPTSVAAIQACATCSSDLVAQRATLSALHATAPAHLETDERSGLRAAVMADLHLEPAPPVAAPATRRQRFTLAWAGAAVLVLVGFVGVTSVFSGLGDNDDIATVSLGGDAATTTEAAGDSDAAAGNPSDSSATIPTTAAIGQDGLSSVDTERAADEGLFRAYRFDFEELESSELLAYAQSTADELADRLGTASLADPLPTEISLACEDAGRGIVRDVKSAYPLFAGTYKGDDALLWVYDTEDGPVTVVHDAEDCSVVAVLP